LTIKLCVVVQFAAQCTKELKTVLVRFDLHIFNRTDCQKTGLSGKNRTPGNPI